MRRTAALFVLAAWAAAGTGLWADGQDKPVLTLTLDEAIAMALRQNPSHLASQEKENQARYLVRQAASAFLPSLNAQGTNTLDEKLFVLEFPSFIPGQPPQRVSVDFTRDYQMSLAFSIPLFAGGRLISGFRQANWNLRASQETVRQSEHETVFNVKRSFYGYLLARHFADVAEEALALAEKFQANVKNLYEVGMASRLDLLRSDVQVANLKPQAIRARNAVEVAELALKTALGIDLDTPIKVEGELTATPLEVDIDAAVEEALTRRPEIRQLDYQSRVAGEMLKSARGSLFPTLAVGGAYNFWADALRFQKGTWQSYYSINLSLTWPIFNGFESRARIGQSQAMIREIDLTRKAVTDMVALEVRQAVLNYRQARETLLSQEKNVEEAREAVRIAELNYAEGLATNLDVSSAQVALSQARTNYAQALYDCVISQAQLDKAVGRSRSN